MNPFKKLVSGIKIVAGTSQTAAKDQFKTWLLAADWQVIADGGTYLDLLPPATETVGNTIGSDVLRLNFNPTNVQMRAIHRIDALVPKKYMIRGNSTGAGTVTVGTQNVSATGVTGTQDGLTLKMYQALTASVATDVLGYNYEFVQANVNTYDDYIIATEKVPGAGANIVAGSNMIVYQWQAANGASSIVDRGAYLANNRFQMTVNYGQDWLVYMGITSRSVILSIRTTSAVLGPMAAQFMNHSDATGQCPAGCIPIELCLVDLGTSVSGNTFTVRFGSLYGYARSVYDSGVYNNSYVVSVLQNSVQMAASLTPTNLVNKSSWMEPSVVGYPGGLSSTNTPSYNDMFAGVANRAAQIVPTALASLGNVGSINVQGWTPAAVLDDCVSFLISGSNEITSVTREPTGTTTLSAPIGAADTSIPLTSAAALPAAGTIVIGAEVITYASKSGNTLNGCNRARANSQAVPHSITEDVYIGFWWIRMNTGAIPAGYVDPSEVV